MNIKVKLSFFAATCAMLCAFVLPIASVSADPVDVFKNNPSCAAGANGAVICGNTGSGLFGIIQSIIRVMLIVGGVIAVIMIIIGGIRYMTAGGDASGVKGAKDTIMYAVIGLVVTILSYAIVNYVVGKL